jgi:hypothetical protein
VASVALGLLFVGCSSNSPPGPVAKPSARSATATPAPASASPSSAAGQSWTFDADAAGRPPAGANVFSGTWAVRAEPGTPSAPNALCQTGQAPFPGLALTETPYRDFSLSARFKPISGKTDQAGGLIFRIRDPRNYYIFRANALENNANVYTYKNGVRRTLKEGSATVRSGVWSELRVEVKGRTLRGFFNGALVVEANDGEFETGSVGLWTKADSVTCFDDVSVSP